MTSIAGSSKSKKKKNENEVEEDSLEVPVLQVGDEVPDFSCDSTTGMFNFHEVIDGSFAVLVTFLHVFDPVATTELGMLAKLKDEFAARECTVIALAVDTKDNNRKWVEDTHEVQECGVSFPIIADHNAEISRLLNLVKPKVFCLFKLEDTHHADVTFHFIVIAEGQCKIELEVCYSGHGHRY